MATQARMTRMLGSVDPTCLKLFPYFLLEVSRVKLVLNTLQSLAP